MDAIKSRTPPTSDTDWLLFRLSMIGSKWNAGGLYSRVDQLLLKIHMYDQLEDHEDVLINIPMMMLWSACNKWNNRKIYRPNIKLIRFCLYRSGCCLIIIKSFIWYFNLINYLFLQTPICLNKQIPMLDYLRCKARTKHNQEQILAIKEHRRLKVKWERIWEDNKPIQKMTQIILRIYR